MMVNPPRLGPRRAVRIRVYDGTYEVLREYRIIHMLDLTDPAIDAMLAGMLAQAVELARTLENEPMVQARIEVWCEVSNTKLRDFAGGPLL